MSLDSFLRRFADGENPRQTEFLPFLCKEGRDERYIVNFRLAEVYLQRGDFAQARVFAERAWLLSFFAVETLKLYIKVCESIGELETIRSIYKQYGIKCAKEGKLNEAMEYFNRWQYTYMTYLNQDRYSYDIDILEAIEKMALPYRWENPGKDYHRLDGRLRIAYLVHGMQSVNGVLVKINAMFARYHDQKQFEVTFFVPETLKFVIKKNPQVHEFIKCCKDSGCSVEFGRYKSKKDKMVSVSRQIREYSPDILVTSAALADFGHYFIAMTRPAPLVVSLLQGPPPQFTSPAFDYAISWSKHPMIDSPVDTSLVNIGIDLPDCPKEGLPSKESLGVPEEAVVMVSAGRHPKFQDKDFWHVILTLLERHPEVHYIAVGPTISQVPYLDQKFLGEMTSRIQLLGWRPDCRELMTIADLLIDTFPSGGGHVLIDAMAMGIPFVSFENNYLKQYDQTDWSVADEFVDIPELIVPRGDLTAMIEAASRLITDNVYRKEMGALCSREIRANMPSPEEGVRALEKVYIEKYRKFTGSKKEKMDYVKERTAGLPVGLKGFLSRFIRKLWR